MRANSDLSVQSSLLNQVYVDAAKYKDAFESIRKIVGQESSLDKIVADFVKVEDQNFALFNYVTEMNNQVTHECAGRTVLVVGEILIFGIGPLRLLCARSCGERANFIELLRKGQGASLPADLRSATLATFPLQSPNSVMWWRGPTESAISS